MHVFPEGKDALIDGRVPSLGGDAAANALEKYGLDFGALNRLNEHDLIISDYNSWCGYYQLSAGIVTGSKSVVVPFRLQNRAWILAPLQKRVQPENKLKLHGVSLNGAGRELSQVVDLEAADQFTEDLRVFFQGKNLAMTEVPA